MKIEKTTLERLQTDKVFANITEAHLRKGEKLAETVKDGDRPEETMTPDELYCLSGYYEYRAIVEADRLANEPEDMFFKFKASDLAAEGEDSDDE